MIIMPAVRYTVTARAESLKLGCGLHGHMQGERKIYDYCRRIDGQLPLEAGVLMSRWQLVSRGN